MNGPYRTPGEGAARVSATDVILRAWELSDAVRDGIVGPEPTPPARWNFIGRLTFARRHQEWRKTWLELALTPTRRHIRQAAEELGADTETLDYILRAHDRVHRDCNPRYCSAVDEHRR